jgi:3-deoxy-D-arabino-heptulosonate 7-phosphate (DAHP) synthase
MFATIEELLLSLNTSWPAELQRHPCERGIRTLKRIRNTLDIADPVIQKLCICRFADPSHGPDKESRPYGPAAVAAGADGPLMRSTTT